MLTDTHAHIHFDGYKDRLDEVFRNAEASHVTRMIAVGVDETDSTAAVKFAQAHENVYASVGLHPHDSDRSDRALDVIRKLASEKKVVAIGECGLDYYYDNAPRDAQRRAFRTQIELARQMNLPMIFHIREAFDDFFSIVDEYEGVRGVVHCFTSDTSNMERAVARGFKIGLNGIMTFTKVPAQLEAAKEAPLDSILLETDCPFLTPVPKRGQENEPANIAIIAQFLANLRDEDVTMFGNATTKNAKQLFGLD